MKSLHFIPFFVVFFVFLWTSCEEIPPTLSPYEPPEIPDTIPDVSNQQRQVLLEEFTGVRCVRCPEGSFEIATLQGIYGPRFVAVQIHAGDWCDPLPESTFDFRTQAGTDLNGHLGYPNSYPEAAINRRLFESELSLSTDRKSWAGYVEQEIAIPPKVKIGLAINHDETEKRLNVQVGTIVEEDILDEEIRLTAYLAEDGIIDVQDSEDGLIYEYEHKNVFRDAFTPYEGTIIPSPMLAGEEPEFELSIPVQEEWNLEKCRVIAFISVAGDSLNVLQAIEKKVIQ